jgi:SAM-dependent methyltransferase
MARAFLGRHRAPAGKYSAIELDDAAIARGAYKGHLGGGDTLWEDRGKFQLSLMRSVGLLPGSRLLDVGCGALRGGVHFIRYLDAGKYVGVDANPSFIRASAHIVASDPTLAEKTPSLATADDFSLPAGADASFDFILAFSVLNHANEWRRELFVAKVPAYLAAGGTMVLTHAQWLRPSDIRRMGLRLLKRLDDGDLDVEEHGWSEADISPVYVLKRSGA